MASAEYNRNYYQRNRERILAQKKLYYALNADLLRQNGRDKYYRNRARNRAYQRHRQLVRRILAQKHQH